MRTGSCFPSYLGSPGRCWRWPRSRGWWPAREWRWPGISLPRGPGQRWEHLRHWWRSPTDPPQPWRRQLKIFQVKNPKTPENITVTVQCNYKVQGESSREHLAEIWDYKIHRTGTTVGYCFSVNKIFPHPAGVCVYPTCIYHFKSYSLNIIEIVK